MKSFSRYLEQKNISLSTIKKYIRQVERFKTFVDKDLEQVSKKDILNYLQFLEENKNLSNRSKQQILGILKHYYNHLEIPNPTNLIKIRGTRRKILYKVLSLEELNEFADLYFYQNEDKRNYLILSLCMYQGLKQSEWKALKLSDIDLQKGMLKVEAQRKSNARTIPLHVSQIGVLYEFMRDINNSKELLFITTPDVQKWTKKLKKLYPKFENFKQIRASIITYWIQTEGLRKAQYKAGHRYISSTEAYLSNDLQSLQDEISQYHPI